MTITTNVLSKQEILKLNITKDTILKYDFQYINGMDCHFITFDGIRKLCFESSILQAKTFRKIKSIGLGWGWCKPLLTDEENGIIQASLNGENPFAFSIICNNPIYNEIIK